MPPVVVKLLAGQCTGRTDGQSGHYYVEHKKLQMKQVQVELQAVNKHESSICFFMLYM